MVKIRARGMHAVVERDGVADAVAVEEPLEIRVDGAPLAVTAIPLSAAAARAAPGNASDSNAGRATHAPAGAVPGSRDSAAGVSR